MLQPTITTELEFAAHATSATIWLPLPLPIINHANLVPKLPLNVPYALTLLLALNAALISSWPIQPLVSHVEPTAILAPATLSALSATLATSLPQVFATQI